jgi:hypothetical protein
VTDAVEKNDPVFEEFRRKVLAVVSENEAHASKMPGIREDKNAKKVFRNQKLEGGLSASRLAF